AVRPGAELLAGKGHADLPAVRHLAAVDRHLRSLWWAATVAVRLGHRARRGRGPPALSPGARRPLGSRGVARRAGRRAADGGGRGRDRRRDAGGAATLRPRLARPGRPALPRPDAPR